MRSKTYLLLLLCGLLLASCGTQKHTGKKPVTDPEARVPSWNTCLIQNAKAIVTASGHKISANVTMQTVRDSMLVISVMPMMGIEMVRLEATPKEVLIFDKINNKYSRTTFEEVNKLITPKLSWTYLQQLCSAELPTGNQKAKLEFNTGESGAVFDITYTQRKLNVPVNMKPLSTSKYKLVDITKIF